MNQQEVKPTTVKPVEVKPVLVISGEVPVRRVVSAGKSGCGSCG